MGLCCTVLREKIGTNFMVHVHDSNTCSSNLKWCFNQFKTMCCLKYDTGILPSVGFDFLLIPLSFRAEISWHDMSSERDNRLGG